MFVIRHVGLKIFRFREEEKGKRKNKKGEGKGKEKIMQTLSFFDNISMYINLYRHG